MHRDTTLPPGPSAHHPGFRSGLCRGVLGAACLLLFLLGPRIRAAQAGSHFSELSGVPRPTLAPTNASAPGEPPATAGPPAAGTNTVSVDGHDIIGMDKLDDTHKLSLGDRLSFRIVEDQEDPRETLQQGQPLTPFYVTDSGDVELPYIGRYPAAGKTCKQLAFELKGALEKKYYYQATVIIALDQITKNTTGRVYVAGYVRLPGAVEIPADEVFTVSKSILRAGGFAEYADKKGVKLTRKNPAGGTQVIEVNVSEILEKGKTEKDLKLEPGDFIFVPPKFINI